MYDTILVAVDGSEGSLAAADHAVDLADRYGATLHVLHVVDDRMSPVDDDMDDETIEALVERSGVPGQRPTEPVRERADRAGVPAVEAIEVGTPFRRIREYVADNDVDLVVVGTHGRTGLSHALLGSVTERVLRTVEVPVLTVRRPDAEER